MSEEQHPILNQLEQIQQDALAVLETAVDEAGITAWRSAHLGRTSPVMTVFSQMGQFPKELRPLVGQRANQVKLALEAALAEQAERVRQAELAQKLAAETLDVTLPGRPQTLGRLHPITQTLREIYRVMGEMGFQVYRARDVETDDYNFTLLNIPPHHPARDMWDTYYMTTPGMVLRTHTSPGQIRAMREYAPDPIRVILPGMCYRYEQVSARSEIQFNQVELLAVGKGITFGDLKGTLTDFARRMFGQNVRTRLRPSYFPFTEPSAEMDVECFVCGGKGCQVCKSSGWLEILGCGMVHPKVLENGGYDPREFTGFAAGMGPERITMLRHRIDDIRYFWSDDVRFLEQF
ncbi:MAG TPA: phenylalanine--tRNA ligase subunit alpha [Anaerolineaceae bacterium]|nr:phenylalanine--tRNA ligase subunit alpha [Anaerolineaceae bacterium]HOU42756.1 phenylalanine--tRNA ligase subunit alpha [Anaerolineaceae bacterium]HQF45214.1 phenylalanine--tRNA ligase subunit alpha [Anaerolineaceae bacterium]HQH35057.1 phenylalanine--tRNA ligase subunit alpha [Anaerolineaceae bacterium]HQJ02376.1 phenylalanine--tRNA ligase subunit alpha [Anaerolineaceae bacterium]